MRPKKKKWGKLKLLASLYDELLYCIMSEGDSAKGMRLNTDEQKIGIDFTGAFGEDSVTFFYTINTLPRELLIDFKENMRDSCKDGVRVSFLNNLRRHRIEWESAQMQSRLRILRQAGEEDNNKDIDAYNMHSNIAGMEKQRWIEESLLYLADADKKRKRALLKSTMLVVVTGRRGVDFDDSVKAIEDCAHRMGFKMDRVMFEIVDLLEYFSPFNRSFNKNMVNSLPTQILTDEIVARYSTYSQGKLGRDGTYFGTDIYSLFSVLKRVKAKDTSAENILITAETGGGKSYFVKAILLQLLAQGFNGTIMDIEGEEYIPLANFLSYHSNVQILNMGEGRGKYFDPMEIADPTGIDDIDRDAKTLSTNFALSVFKVLLGKTYDENTWYDTIINDAVTETYRDHGVTEEMSTWGNSKGLELADVYATLISMERFRDDEEYASAVRKTIAVISKYFDEDGAKAYYFKDKLKVSDIIDADLIVCSFGMAGKSPQAIDPVQMALMQLGAAHLSYQRSIFSLTQGKYNFKLWEEFQRWGKFPDSEKTLGVALTGGRKLGDVNFIITNVVSELLKDDKFGIFDNITSFLIGAIGDSKTRNDLCTRLSIPKMQTELDLLASARPDLDGSDVDEDTLDPAVVDSPYSYAFLCGLDRSKYSLVKMLLPPEIAQSKIFKTGVNKKKKENISLEK